MAADMIASYVKYSLFSLRYIELNNLFSRWSVNRCKSIPLTVG